TGPTNPTGPGEEHRIEFDFTPTTSVDFSNLWIEVFVRNTTNGSLTPIGSVQKIAYASVNGSVYHFVYDFTYLVPENFQLLKDQVYASIYQTNGVLFSVYLKLEPRPPSGGGGGGGGGGRATPPSQTVEAGTVTTSGGTTILTVTPSRVQSLVAQAGTSVVLSVTPAAGTTAAEVRVDAQSLQTLQAAGKPVVIQAGEVAVNLPPAVLNGIQLQSGQTLAVRVKVLTEAETDDLVARANRDSLRDLVLAGAPVDVEIAVAKGSEVVEKVERFDQPVELTLPYDAERLAGIDPLKLGVYRWNAEGGTWDYVGGRVDVQAGVVRVARSSLSTYAVMAFDKTFADLAQHWARADVEVMAARHIVRGVTDTTFAPDRSISRAEFAALVVRALGLGGGSGAARFADVGGAAWYAPEVAAAAAAGIVQGYGDGTFRPEAAISRQEMAVMISRAMVRAGRPGPVSEAQATAVLARFGDRGAIAGWAATGAANAVEAGIIQGRAAGTFAPEATATRAEATVMLKRLLSYLNRL
ncbi:MAG: S-layer homology domain-containing protein, partial [Clostridia bacterium]|nr:S-layer homology domain-containing protein [Clostridia bacterium]